MLPGILAVAGAGKWVYDKVKETKKNDKAKKQATANNKALAEDKSRSEYDERNARMSHTAAGVQQRSASTLYNDRDQRSQDANLSRQKMLGDMMVNDARKNMGAPSVAEAQLRSGADMAASQVSSNIASQRGVNPALAARMANTQTANIMQNTNQQAGQLRAQEHQQNLGRLMAAQQASAGIQAGVYGQRANSANANLNADVNQRKANDQYALGKMGFDMSSDQMRHDTRQDIVREDMAGQAYEDSRSDKRWDRGMQIAGTVASAAGSAAMLSDKNAKKNIRPTDGLASRMMDELKPVTWDYKEERGGEKDYAGIIAQDLEKSELGKSLVMDTEKGKVIDMKRGLSALMASSAEINERLKRLEA